MASSVVGSRFTCTGPRAVASFSGRGAVAADLCSLGSYSGCARCPCALGSLRLIGRSGRRLLAKKISNKVPICIRHYRYISLPQAQMPNQNEEEQEVNNSETSSNGRLFPSASSSEAGDNGSILAKQPRIPYGLTTGLASVGFLETAYLTWSKFSGAAVTCPLGGICTDVLDSPYATIFGVPLALIGMIAYGSVAFLGGTRVSGSPSDWFKEGDWVRWLLVGCTTSMAVASAYFMYVLTTKLEGASCAYCVGSALLSLSLLLSTLRGFTLKDVRTIAGLQLGVGLAVLVILSNGFGEADALARQRDIDLAPVEMEVITVSTSREISLAKYLQSIGAKMYGAFWCSHCYEQKQMFGREAMKFVDYVECYPEGYRKGVQIAKACDIANIQGFPTWIIKGQTLSGEQELESLAKAAGFDASKLQ